MNVLALNEFLNGALVAALVGLGVLTVVRVVVHIRGLHRRGTSKRFMAKYRATHPRASKAPVEVPMSLGRLVIRSRTSANVGEPR
jgi:hypothetical protein